jgi:hypothetical protein
VLVIFLCSISDNGQDRSRGHSNEGQCGMQNSMGRRPTFGTSVLIVLLCMSVFLLIQLSDKVK